MGRYINKKTNSGALGISKTLCIFYLLQDDGLLILQRSGCKPYIAHGIGCNFEL